MFYFIKPDEGPDGQDGHITSMQIHQEKTLQHNTIWGQAMRNRYVKMCPMRSNALYLFHRFEVTQEEFDFSENSNWCSRKLMVSSDTTSSLDKDMWDRFYGKML
jgi:formylmethanofuran:tetrahydromethanopterin formyltransferase